ncbi:cysteine proteinase inhibitor 5 [Prunus yedoensis var. nudiflora]|uniref:Cysteine proteinase inhibitor 5 n=1 Tax=Prunus yedoensis var. nudiflora TaxID=2094558 RepID=A0A314Y9L5_PRUYE|nr:cysteine proteinase inhibitor 5 [Prunus yedoensis var. nudiflora]
MKFLRLGIPYRTQPYWINTAEFAVSSYNKDEKKNLVFESVVKGKTRYEVTGLYIVLVIKVKDGSLPSANYDVGVRDKYAGPADPLHLIYFRKRPLKFYLDNVQ